MKQIRMKATFVSNHVSKKGTRTFVYELRGLTDEQLAKYKEAQGDYYRENENGVPLFFTTRFTGQDVTVLITVNNRVVVDDSENQAAASMAAAYGGNLGQALADKFAERIAANSRLRINSTATADAPEATAEPANTASAGMDKE